MVGMQVQWVTRYREISRPASSRSQRGMITVLVASNTARRTKHTRPVMWKNGTTPRPTDSTVDWVQLPLTALLIRLRSVSYTHLTLPTKA